MSESPFVETAWIEIDSSVSNHTIHPSPFVETAWIEICHPLTEERREIVAVSTDGVDLECPVICSGFNICNGYPFFRFWS